MGTSTVFSTQSSEFLIQLAGGATGVALPTPDDTGSTINMSGTNGKVALVNSITALTGTCPTTNIIDFIGYGTTANCNEGGANALLVAGPEGRHERFHREAPCEVHRRVTAFRI